MFGFWVWIRVGILKLLFGEERGLRWRKAKRVLVEKFFNNSIFKGKVLCVRN